MHPWIASYQRISNDPLNLAAGVTRQRTDNRTIASNRWPDREIREYTDNDISASRYSRKVRPMFVQLCEDIEQGRVHAMVGWNFDRVFRKPSELEAFLDLCDRVKFTRAVTAQGDVDLTTDDGRLHARIMVAVAAKASDDTSRRVKRALRDRDEAGIHRGGRVVYGYVQQNGCPVVLPLAAKCVREAADRVLNGEPLRSIAKDLPLGAPRTGAGVRKMLLSPTLTGRTTSGARGTWEPILTDVQAAELRSMLQSPARRYRAPSGERVWWLSGLVRCGVCDYKMRVVSDNASHKGARNYQCHQTIQGRACGSVAIRVDRLHWHVEGALFDTIIALDRVRVGSAGGIDDGGSGALTDVATEDRLTELATLYATGGIGRAEWEAARKVLTVKQHPVPSVVLRPVADLAARWEGMTPHERHQHASRLIDRVTVYPRVRGGAKWQPHRIQVRWLQ